VIVKLPAASTSSRTASTTDCCPDVEGTGVDVEGAGVDEGRDGDGEADAAAKT
jgi:hypothetical protein